MYPRQEEFVQQVFDYVANVCKNQLANVRTYDNDNKVFDVLGIYEKDLRTILRKIACALPDYVYNNDLVDIYNEVSEYIAREYILFQTQEDITNENFIDYLTCFIYESVNAVNYTYRFTK